VAGLPRHDRGGETVPELLGDGEGVGVTEGHAFAHDEVGAAVAQGGEDRGEVLDPDGVVAVEHHDDVGRIGGEVADPREHGAAVAPAGLRDDLSPGGEGDPGAPVRRAVVAHDHAIALVQAMDLGEDDRERLRFVEDRDEDRDAHAGLRLVRGGGERAAH
jgi:hypothetical protein